MLSRPPPLLLCQVHQELKFTEASGEPASISAVSTESTGSLPLALRVNAWVLASAAPIRWEKARVMRDRAAVFRLGALCSGRSSAVPSLGSLRLLDAWLLLDFFQLLLHTSVREGRHWGTMVGRVRNYCRFAEKMSKAVERSAVTCQPPTHPPLVRLFVSYALFPTQQQQCPPPLPPHQRLPFPITFSGTDGGAPAFSTSPREVPICADTDWAPTAALAPPAGEEAESSIDALLLSRAEDLSTQ